MADRQPGFRPGEIERKSFAIIDSEVPEPRPFKGEQWLVARRMIHSSADFELLSLVRFHPGAVQGGVDALSRPCLIVTDTEMARIGITSSRMDRLGCRVECHINNQEVREKAERDGTTRAAAAVDFALSRLSGSICVVGNAPTALLRLLHWMETGACRPALIVGMPVGFVNAAESKDLLMKQQEVPFITIRGRKGGSSLAASVVNQLAEIALAKRTAGGNVQ